MTFVAHHWPDVLVMGILVFCQSIAYAVTLAPGLTWANNGTDGGDLVSAAVTLGVAHPTGYPTYVLLLQPFLLLPWGDAAFQANLFSAMAAVLAAIVMYGLVGTLTGRGWTSRVAAGLTTLSFGLTPLLWSQAVIAEVHTLNVLFVALLLRFTLQKSLSDGKLAVVWQGMVAGLALGNHVTIGLTVAIWLVALALSSSLATRPRLLARAMVGLVCGLLVYLYVPLRAAADPAINWGQATDWEGFWWVVSGQPYRELAFGIPASALVGRVEAWAALLRQQFGLVGIGLSVLGVSYGMAPARFLGLSAVVALGSSAFAIGYNTADSAVYLLPCFLVIAVWMGLGLQQLLALGCMYSPAWAPALAAGLAVLILWPVPTTSRQVDASHDDRATHFANTVVAAVPTHALVLTTSDLDSFPLWYYQHALGRRRDLAIVVGPLLEFGWYRRHLRVLYPDLALPEQQGGYEAALIRANPARPLCRVTTRIAPWPDGITCSGNQSP